MIFVKTKVNTNSTSLQYPAASNRNLLFQNTLCLLSFKPFEQFQIMGTPYTNEQKRLTFLLKNILKTQNAPKGEATTFGGSPYTPQNVFPYSSASSSPHVTQPWTREGAFARSMKGMWGWIPARFLTMSTQGHTVTSA